MKVGIFFARRAAKRAETTAYKTHIGEVDVAIDDVGDHIADALSSHTIRCEHQRFQLSPGRQRKPQTIIEVEFVAVKREFQRARYLLIYLGEEDIQSARLPIHIFQRAHLSIPTR